VKLVLVFPPLAEPAQPYSALPSLTAYLKERGWRDVRQMDVNIEFVRHILTREQLERALARIEEQLAQMDEQGSAGSGGIGDVEKAADEYGALVNATMRAPFVVEGIRSAVEELQNPGSFKDIERLNRNKRLVQEALQIFSAATFPLRMSYAHTPGPVFARPTELRKWAVDVLRNPFCRFFLEDTLPRLRSPAPDIVGISITYYSQLLPAVTLATLIKQNLEGVRIVFGGNVVSVWYDTLETCPEIFDWCDYLVPFEGESSLHGLLKALDGGQPLAGVPNLVYPREGIIHKNPVIIEDMDALPTPDYGGLPLDRYLAQAPVFLLFTSRGCYWSRCLFCSVSAAMRRGYRMRSPQKIHRDIVNISEKYNGRYIAFGDDCVSPATLKDLVSILKEKGPEIYWQCEVRFEEAFTPGLLAGMKQTGCLNLIFGLESYSPRVLNLMRKGVHQDQVERILEDCRRSGIAFNLQFFFGFPGESEAEARITADFIKKQAHGAATFSFGTFELLRGSEVEKNPGKFHIRAVDRSVGPLAVAYDYTPASGHAKGIKDGLMDELYGDIKYPYAGLSITAHTLLFLHLAGTDAMGTFYEKRDPIPGGIENLNMNLMERRLERPEMQTVGSFAHLPHNLVAGAANPGTHENENNEKNEEGNEKENEQGKEHLLLYDYRTDRLVEISPVVVWILKGLDGTTTPSQLIARLEEETGAVLDGREVVHGALKELYKRGMCR